MTDRVGRGAVLALPALALLLLAAHGLRAGNPGLCAAWLGMLWLLFSGRAWARLVLMASLLWGSVLWADSLVFLVRLRQAMGLPHTRLALIIGLVIALTILAFFLLLGPRGGRAFAKNREKAIPQAAAFLITVALLAMAREKSPMAVLLIDRYELAGSWGWGWLEIWALGVYAALVCGAMLDPARARRIRPRIWLIFSLVFFGQLLLGLAGLENMLMTGRLHLPVPALIVGGPIFRGGGLFMVILFASTVLLVGPAWCSHLCYIGAWDDSLSRRTKPGKVSAALPRATPFYRIGTLALVVGAALLLRRMGAPVLVAVWLAAAFGLLGVGVMLFLSSRFGVMTHCTGFCPMGMVANLLGRLTPWRMRMSPECTKCGVCVLSCCYLALRPEHIEKGRPGISCTLCGDCVGGCPHNAMQYRFARLSPQTSRQVFLTLVTALHACFLGVARI